MKTMPPAQPLALAFRRQQEGFLLDVAWRTNAKRLSILGASGSGKSATLRLIAGLDRADSAALSFGDRELAGIPPYDRAVAYVPQNYGLLPNVPVDQQIRFAVDCDMARALHWTERLGLAGLEHRLPAELSLGQQQRVALARALSRQGSLLLLDEPFSALDAPLRARLVGELAALQREIDATTIVVTHDPAEAILLADEMLLLEDGRVLQSGLVETVFLRPASEIAARLLGAQNVAAGWAVASDRIDLGGVHITVAGPALTDGSVGWAVRPDSVRVGTGRGIPGTVLQVADIRGGQRRLLVRVGNAVLQATAESGDAIGLGDCRVSIDPASVQIWPGDLASRQGTPVGVAA
jgi:molybdate transport system permease protein